MFVIDFRMCADINVSSRASGDGVSQEPVSSSMAKKMIWQKYNEQCHNTIVMLYPEAASPSMGKHDLLEIASATKDSPYVASTFSAKAQVISPSRVLVISRLSIGCFFKHDARLGKAQALFQEVVHDFSHIAESKMSRRQRRANPRLNMSLLFAAAAANFIARQKNSTPGQDSCGSVRPFIMFSKGIR